MPHHDDRTVRVLGPAFGEHVMSRPLGKHAAEAPASRGHLVGDQRGGCRACHCCGRPGEATASASGHAGNGTGPGQ